MNNRQLITILVALGLVAVGVVWKFSSGSGTTSGRQSLALDRALPDFPLNEVVAIQIKNQKEEVNLALQGETWGVKERDAYPANFDFVKDLVTKAHDLRVIEQVKIGQSQLGRLQLVSPAAETAKEAKPEQVGTLVIFKKANDQELGRLLLGKSIEREASPDNPFFNVGGASGRFVQVGEVTDTAYKVKEAFSSLNVDVKGWLEKSFISPTGGLKSIEVKVADPADQSWKVEKEKEGADAVLADKKEGEQIDPEKVKQAGSAFSSAYFTDVATTAEKEKTGLDAPLRTATVSFFDGFTYTLKIGNKAKPDDENSDYYMMVSAAYTPLPAPSAPAAAEPPAEPQPTPAPEGETADQKTEREKKDAEARTAWEQAKQSIESAKTQYESELKQWEEAKTKKEERLAKEKTFEGRTYIVSKYTVDWFLKDRSHFKAAAPAASAPGAAAAPATPSLPELFPAGGPRSDAPKPIEAVTPPIKVEIPQPKTPEPKESPVQPAEKPKAPEQELPPASFTPEAEPPPAPPAASEAPTAAPAPEPAAPAAAEPAAAEPAAPAAEPAAAPAE
jgi:hypothetical protein